MSGLSKASVAKSESLNDTHCVECEANEIVLTEHGTKNFKCR